MLQTQQIKTTAALALALGAIAAPTALANGTPTGPIVRPNPDEQTAIVNQATPSPTQGAPVARPNPDEQTTSSAADRQPRVSVPPTTIVRVITPSGFDWGDAGIGAAGGLGLTLVALGGALTVGRRRERQPRSTARAAG